MGSVALIQNLLCIFLHLKYRNNIIEDEYEN